MSKSKHEKLVESLRKEDVDFTCDLITASNPAKYVAAFYTHRAEEYQAGSYHGVSEFLSEAIEIAHQRLKSARKPA